MLILCTVSRLPTASLLCALLNEGYGSVGFESVKELDAARLLGADSKAGILRSSVVAEADLLFFGGGVEEEKEVLVVAVGATAESRSLRLVDVDETERDFLRGEDDEEPKGKKKLRAGVADGVDARFPDALVDEVFLGADVSLSLSLALVE